MFSKLYLLLKKIRTGLFFQFTVEREINGHLAFLDLNVHRTVEGKLESDVYRKPTHTQTNTCHTTLITQ